MRFTMVLSSVALAAAVVGLGYGLTGCSQESRPGAAAALVQPPAPAAAPADPSPVVIEHCPT